MHCLDKPSTEVPLPYADWKCWPTISDKQLRALAELVTPHMKWLAPEIVWGIAAYNEAHRTEWSEQLKDADVTRPESYLWAYSPCGLPGVRRHGSPDGNTFRKAEQAGDIYKCKEALCTDDNVFPKRLWHWAQWGGGRGKTKPKDYHLSHLFDHTDFQARRHGKISAEESWLAGSYWENQVDYGFAGMYTSVANYCYIPSALMKPTDHNEPLKRLLLQRAVYLYHRPEKCELFPHQLEEKLSVTTETQWWHEDFCWDEKYTGHTADTAINKLNAHRAGCFQQLVEARRNALGLMIS